MNTSKSLDEILDFIENYAVSSSSSDFAYYPEKRTQAKQAIVEAVEGLIPKIKHTAEELLEINSHLDSRSLQSNHDYNRGFIEAVEMVNKAIKEWQDG